MTASLLPDSSRGIIRKILDAAFVVGGATILVKLLGFMRELFVAHQFGRGDEIDAFIIAFAVPSFVVSLFSTAVGAAVMPTFIELRHRGTAKAAQQLLSSITLVCLLGMLVVSAVMLFTSANLFEFFASGFDPSKQAAVRKLFILALPVLVLGGVSSLWSAILNAREQFWLAALSPCLISMVSILSLMLAPEGHEIDGLAIGVVLGTGMQAAVLGRGVVRCGYRLRPAWHGMTASLRQTAAQSVPVILGTLMMSGTVIVDQAMATMLDRGSVAALSYSDKLLAFGLGLVVTTIGTAALPYFAKQAAEQDWTGIKNTLQFFVVRIFMIAAPIIIGMSLLSESIVRLVFERGAFNEHDTALVSRVFVCHVIQMPFYVAGLLIVRVISVMKANRFLLYGNAISFVINISLNYVLMKAMGIAGIALATSIVYILAFGYLATVARALLNRSIDRMAFNECARAPDGHQA